MLLWLYLLFFAFWPYGVLLEGDFMASVFTSVWQACFGWVNQLLFMDLPIYLGDNALNTLDIIVGTFGIFVGVSALRALVRSSFTFVGEKITNTISEHKDHDFKTNDWQYKDISKSIKQHGSVDVKELREKGIL